MGFFDSITTIVTAPIKVAAEVVEDISGDNDELNQGLSLTTLGLSSVIKGTAKTIKKASEELDD